MADDPNWPRANAWLGGKCKGAARARLAIIGAPLRVASITPGRCDLAPEAIRTALKRFSTYDFDAAMDVRDVVPIDRGDLPLSHSWPDDALEPLSTAVAEALIENDAVVLLGGDNSVTRPGVHGLGASLNRCGLLTFDAHLDLRSLDEGLSNGNPVRALLSDGFPGDHIIQVGVQSFANSGAYAGIAREAGIQTITADAVRTRGIDLVVEQALERLSQDCDCIYVDLDLDVMDRAFVPGTPGSRPGGLSPAELRRAVHRCGAHRHVRALDIVEFDPTKDVGDVTALTAAACLLSFASGLLCRTRDRD